MDSYPSHFAYAASADANAYMSSLRYPGMGMTPMLGPMHMEPMYNAPITSEPAPTSNALPCSSRIGNKSSSSFIYRFDETHGASKIKCHQLCTSDGRLFVEHLPNHTILYIPNSSSIEQALCELRKPRSQTKQQKHNASLQQQQQQEQLLSQPQPEPQQPVVRKPKEKSAKPINAFIKYRSFKIAELKEQYPEVSQTEISRLAGECWKTEDEVIKNQFRDRYQEEKKVYDLKKAIGTGTKRAREPSVTLSENDAASVLGNATSAPSSDECGGSADASLSDVYPADFDPKRRRRSLTLPPTGAAACVRSSSSSPMLQPQAASKRRRCVTTELRRQLAAKSSAIMATPPPPPQASVAPTMIASRSLSMDDEHHQYAGAPAGGYYGDLSFAVPGCNDHIVLSTHNSPAMMAAMHPHASAPYLNDMSLPLNPTFGMHHHSDFASVSPPHLASDGSVLSISTSFTSTDPTSEHHSAPFDIYSSPVHSDLANSVVNAHLVAANLSSFMAADSGYPHHSTHHGLADNIDSLSASEYFH
ncbi:hypothetical protein GGH91_001741 [Coemansia sp. RSA 2671]|nr:hypothetical protein GGH91_001741 [Coemansia sp. RSA 2671]